jgi:hypothetical protein
MAETIWNWCVVVISRHCRAARDLKSLLFLMFEVVTKALFAVLKGIFKTSSRFFGCAPRIGSFFLLSGRRRTELT